MKKRQIINAVITTTIMIPLAYSSPPFAASSPSFAPATVAPTRTVDEAMSPRGAPAGLAPIDWSSDHG